MVGDAARQGLGGLAEQIGRRAAENQEAGRTRPPVGEHSKGWKEPGASLDLVDDHAPPEQAQSQASVG